MPRPEWMASPKRQLGQDAGQYRMRERAAQRRWKSGAQAPAGRGNDLAIRAAGPVGRPCLPGGAVGVRFTDGWVDGTWLSEQLQGVRVLLLIACESRAAIPWHATGLDYLARG